MATSLFRPHRAFHRLPRVAFFLTLTALVTIGSAAFGREHVASLGGANAFAGLDPSALSEGAGALALSALVALGLFRRRGAKPWK